MTGVQVLHAACRSNFAYDQIHVQLKSLLRLGKIYQTKRRFLWSVSRPATGLHLYSFWLLKRKLRKKKKENLIMGSEYHNKWMKWDWNWKIHKLFFHPKIRFEWDNGDVVTLFVFQGATCWSRMGFCLFRGYIWKVIYSHQRPASSTYSVYM